MEVIADEAISQRKQSPTISVVGCSGSSVVGMSICYCDSGLYVCCCDTSLSIEPIGTCVFSMLCCGCWSVCAKHSANGGLRD